MKRMSIVHVISKQNHKQNKICKNEDIPVPSVRTIRKSTINRRKHSCQEKRAHSWARTITTVYVFFGVFFFLSRRGITLIALYSVSSYNYKMSTASRLEWREQVHGEKEDRIVQCMCIFLEYIALIHISVTLKQSHFTVSHKRREHCSHRVYSYGVWEWERGRETAMQLRSMQAMFGILELPRFANITWTAYILRLWFAIDAL